MHVGSLRQGYSQELLGMSDVSFCVGMAGDLDRKNNDTLHETSLGELSLDLHSSLSVRTGRV